MKRSILSLAVIAMAASCSPMEPAALPPAEGTPLQVSVSHDAAVASRALVQDTSLQDGTQIGLSLHDISGATYQGTACENRLYRACGSGGGQTWQSESPIMVSNTPGTLYGYYPYSPAVESVASIPVKADSDNQTDWMYAEPAGGITKANCRAQVTMKHALSAVRIIAKRGTYTGTGEITGISVCGDRIATSAILDARTGALSCLEGFGQRISVAVPPAPRSSILSADVVVIPTEEASDAVIGITMDGSEYRLTLEGVVLEQGRVTECEVTFNDGKVNVTDVTITAWSYEMAGSQTVRKDFNVTMDGDTDGLSFSSDVDEEGNVTILAVPHISRDAEARPVTIIGEAALSQSIDERTGVLTIRLSDIRSDVSVVFAGFDLWMTFTHEITDISKPTQIYKSGTDRISRIRIDGLETDTDNTHQFDATGTHVMKMALKDRRAVPGALFHYITTVTGASFPEGVESLGQWVFLGCTGLREVSLPSTLRSIDYQCFERSGLVSVTVPQGCSMNYSIFSSCTSLTCARLPEDMRAIPKGTFNGCSSLTDFEFPSGVTSIGESAFSGCGLQTLHFPDGVSELPPSVCSGCSGLREVRLPASLTRIGRNAFSLCVALERFIPADGTLAEGTIVIPEGVTEVGPMALMTRSPHLTTISIPSSLTTIEPGALCCPEVSGFVMPEGNPAYDIRSHSVVERATGRLVAGSTQSSPVDGSVSIIGEYAFYESLLSTIDLHEGVTQIEDRAFQYADFRTVICRAPTPPALGKDSFQVQKYNGKLKVPSQALDAYSQEWMKDENGSLGAAYLKWSIVALADDE